MTTLVAQNRPRICDLASNAGKKALRVMLVAGALMAVALPSARAAQTVVKLAHTEAGSGDLLHHPYYTLTQVFSRYVDSRTHGRYKVQVFPNGQLGDLESLAQQASKGIIQMAVGLSPGHLASWDPDIQVLEMPYAFPNRSVAFEVLNYSKFGRELADEVAKKSNLRILAYMPSAFRSFTNSKHPVHSANDMKGLKIRVQKFPIYVAMVKALGANPTPIAWSELYNALQTGVVDGEENAPYTLLLANLQQVQKYYTLDQHVLNTPLITINEHFYEQLSPEDKATFRLAAREAAIAFCGVVVAKEGQDLATIRKAGVQIYTPTPAQRQTFVKATRGPLEAWMKKNIHGDWLQRLLDAVKAAQQ